MSSSIPGQTPSILFVDDEEIILRTLEQLLLDEGWNCHFVSSARAALDFLEQKRIDLLISDVVMPEMNGIELLESVKQQYPAVIRIFLTAYAKDERTVQALSVGLAQQIIPKPWLDQELIEVIRSALRQSNQQKKQSLNFQRLINSIPLLPTLPESYSQVQSCIVDDDVNIEKMATLIGQDVAMASALLHWANSALFGQRYRVDTIKKAIIVLGTDIVINLILSEAVSKRMTGSLPLAPGFDLHEFKCHSIATAVISRMLAKSIYSSDTDLHDRAFIAGLLHDIGKLVAAGFFKETFSAALKQAKQTGCRLIEAEAEILGVTHPELGSFLAEWWALPHYIISAIEGHHAPQASPIDPEIVNAVYLANLLSYKFGFGDNGKQTEPKIDQKIWQKFYLTEEGLEILQVETEKIVNALCSGL